MLKKKTNKQKKKNRLLREDKLTLDKAISICRSEEKSVRQIQKMNEEQGNTVRVVKRKKKKKKKEKENRKVQQQARDQIRIRNSSVVNAV